MIKVLHQTPLGMLEISGSEDTIYSLRFADHPTEAEEQKKGALPPAMHRCVQQLDEYFEGRRRTFSLPVRQQGTPFQQSVWQALLQIPYGSTCSYLQLARSLGNIKSIRAVGTTNGRNQLSIVVPCHRVVGSDGSLTGYAGGLWRKQWLLEHEKRIRYGIQMLF